MLSLTSNNTFLFLLYSYNPVTVRPDYAKQDWQHKVHTCKMVIKQIFFKNQWQLATSIGVWFSINLPICLNSLLSTYIGHTKSLKQYFSTWTKTGWDSNRILFLYHTPERIGLKYSLKYLSTILSSYSTNRCWLQCCNRLFLDNCHSSCYFKDHKAFFCWFITKARVLLYHHQYRNTSCNSYFLHLSCSNATNLLSSEGKTHNSVQKRLFCLT